MSSKKSWNTVPNLANLAHFPTTTVATTSTTAKDLIYSSSSLTSPLYHSSGIESTEWMVASYSESKGDRGLQLNALSADHDTVLSHALIDFMDPHHDGDDSSLDQYDEAGPQYAYVEEYGRIYLNHPDTELYMPSDNSEAKRQDMAYTVYKGFCNNQVIFAPIENPKRILDIGAGSGAFARDAAEMFPDAEVTASDIHPLTVNQTFPANVSIVAEDALKGDFGDLPYSFIHARCLLGCFTDYRQILASAYKYLEPGGYMQCVELYPMVYLEGQQMPPDDPVLEWHRSIDQAFMQVGKPLRIANKIAGWMQNLGFEDVNWDIQKCPIGDWPKDPRLKMGGNFYKGVFRESLSTFSLRAFSHAWGWSPEEIEVYLTSAKRALGAKSLPYYHNYYITYGRKPLNAKMTPLP